MPDLQEGADHVVNDEVITQELPPSSPGDNAGSPPEAAQPPAPQPEPTPSDDDQDTAKPDPLEAWLTKDESPATDPPKSDTPPPASPERGAQPKPTTTAEPEAQPRLPDDVWKTLPQTAKHAFATLRRQGREERDARKKLEGEIAQVRETAKTAEADATVTRRISAFVQQYGIDGHEIDRALLALAATRSAKPEDRTAAVRFYESKLTTAKQAAGINDPPSQPATSAPLGPTQCALLRAYGLDDQMISEINQAAVVPVKPAATSAQAKQPPAPAEPPTAEQPITVEQIAYREISDALHGVDQPTYDAVKAELRRHGDPDRIPVDQRPAAFRLALSAVRARSALAKSTIRPITGSPPAAAGSPPTKPVDPLKKWEAEH